MFFNIYGDKTLILLFIWTSLIFQSSPKISKHLFWKVKYIKSKLLNKLWCEC